MQNNPVSLALKPALTETAPTLPATDALMEGGPEGPGAPAAIPGEKFIPIDREKILERLLDTVYAPAQRRGACEVMRYLCGLRQVHSAVSLDRLTGLYDAFNPDDETIDHGELTGDDRAQKLKELEHALDDLVTSANFYKIDDAALKAMLADESGYAMSAEVDLDEYDLNLLYYRGEAHESKPVPIWWKPWSQGRPTDIPAFRRLFIALKLKPQQLRLKELVQSGLTEDKAVRKLKNDRKRLLAGVSDDRLHLKLFRRIPKDDLRILYPNAKIKFNLFDKLMLWVGSGGSTLFAIVMAGLKFVAAVAISLFFIVITLTGAVGAIVRSVMNFFNTRNRYMMKLAQSLYFHNLANNQSVLALLVDEAEEEDIKEEALAYSFLLATPGDDHLHEVKAQVEDFLRREFNVAINFDIEDALARLERDGLAIRTPEGRYDALTLDEALISMRARWNQALDLAHC